MCKFIQITTKSDLSLLVDHCIQGSTQGRLNTETAERVDPDLMDYVLCAGISLLRTLCQKGVHLGTDDPAHMVRNC